MLSLVAGLAVAVHAGISDVKVACIGDSLTVGARLKNAAIESYPAQLGQKLGEGYEVKNFGVGGHTLSISADMPYLKSPRYKVALDYKPDVTIIMLGTNDTPQSSRRPNWEKNRDIERSLSMMVKAFQERNEDVVVFVLGPSPMLPDLPGLSTARKNDLAERQPRLNSLRPRLKKAAKDLGVLYFDMNKQVKWGNDSFSDGTHLTAKGGALMAEFLATEIKKIR